MTNDQGRPPDEAFKEVPGPPPQVEAPGGNLDAKAKKEAVGIAAGTLEDDAKQQEHVRTQALRNLVHKAVTAVVWVVFGIYVLSVLVLAWHSLLPERFAWLSSEQQRLVTTFVFSSALTSAAGGYLMKRLD